MLQSNMSKSPSGVTGSQIYEERYTNDNVSTRYWSGSSRGAEHRVQNVLPVQQRLLWPGAKHTYLPRLLRASRRIDAIDETELQSIIQAVIASNPKAVEDYKKGKTNAVMFLVGASMRKLKGRASAENVKKLIVAYLDAM